MTALLTIARMLIEMDRRAMFRGAVLSILVLLMGAALLGVSGWFITATGVAGLAGIGIAFDVFRPSASVRFLALGRTAARYGERLLTHDATLRALTALRVVLLRGVAGGDAKDLSQLRSEEALTRIISDVDALDGVILRLVLPIIAAVATQGLVFLLLGFVVGWPVAFAVLGIYLPFGAWTLFRLSGQSIAPSSRAEDTGQILRRGVIDMIRDREALILAAHLAERENHLLKFDELSRNAARQLDRAERDANVLMSLVVAFAAMTAFLAGAWLLAQGMTTTAKAVVGLFVALALGEALMPLRRGMSELGRMTVAAERVLCQIVNDGVTTNDPMSRGDDLLCIDRPGCQMTMSAGQTIAMTGASGVGKSSLLMQIAGLSDAEGILINGLAPKEWPEKRLRQTVSVLPQRTALVAGTIRDNLTIAGDFSDTEIWEALKAVALSEDIQARGGLDARLREGGSGLSGGQARRLALARNILKKPEILLLDEPTEGLDQKMASRVLVGIRTALPEALIIATMHRGADHPIFEQMIELKR